MRSGRAFSTLDSSGSARGHRGAALGPMGACDPRDPTALPPPPPLMTCRALPENLHSTPDPAHPTGINTRPPSPPPLDPDLLLPCPSRCRTNYIRPPPRPFFGQIAARPGHTARPFQPNWPPAFPTQTVRLLLLNCPFPSPAPPPRKLPLPLPVPSPTPAHRYAARPMQTYCKELRGRETRTALPRSCLSPPNPGGAKGGPGG